MRRSHLLSPAGLAWLGVAFLVGYSSAGRADQTWEISAPVLPDVLTLYQYEGANFPTSLGSPDAAVPDGGAMTEIGLALQVAEKFEDLLPACKAYEDTQSSTYPYAAITLWATGDPPLTAEQLATNYELVAECSYQVYTDKPYWIPQLVDDVDLCGLVEGTDWRMITEDDVNGFDSTTLQFFHDTLTPMVSSADGCSMGSFYFSLLGYIRGSDQSLKVASLDPTVPASMPTRIVTMASLSGYNSKSHLESQFGEAVVLRCVRQISP